MDAQTPSTPRRAVGLMLGALLLLAAWAGLVSLAIVEGRARAWGLVALLGVGAFVCLFLALLLLTRSRAVRRGSVIERCAPSHRASHRA